jgi:aminopeptidase N
MLLYKEGSTPLQIKQQISYVVCHELAHQWFGNLVTMEWWTDLWLNEGFATWVGTRAVAEFFPEWSTWDDFVVTELGRGLGLDALRSSHPVEVEMRSSTTVNEVFDAISYSKGSCCIRTSSESRTRNLPAPARLLPADQEVMSSHLAAGMLDAYLSEATMRDGLRAYVKKFAYKNASTTDLWQV